MAARLSSTAGRTSLVAAAIVPWNSGTIVGATPSAFPPKGNSKIVSPPPASGPDAMSYIREILTNEGSGVDISVTTGSGTVAGDLILVFHSNDYNDLVNLTPPTTGSWTLQASGDNGTLSSHVRVWSGTAAGGAQTITVQPTVSGEEHALFVVVFNSGSYTVDGAAGNNGSASASQVCPSVTTSGTLDVLLTMPTTLGAVGGTYTPPAGTTKRATTNDPTFAFTTSLGTEVLTSAGATGTRTWTFSASIGAWASVSIAVNVGAGGGPATVNGDAALSSDTALAASALVTELPSAGLSAMSTMVTPALNTVFASAGLSQNATLVAIPTVKGDASLSQNATLVANALVTELPIISFTGQAVLTAPALNTVKSAAAFTIQAIQNTTALVTVLGASAETVQANLAIGNLVTVFGVSTQSANATLSATGTVITSGPSAALTGQATMAVTALVTELPSSALSQNMTMTVSGVITRLGTASLSQNMTLATNSVVSTTGVSALSAILTLTASGTIGSLPISAALSVDSTLSVSAIIARIGTANLSADLSLTANGKASAFATSGLSTTTTLSVVGIVTKLGAANLSAQSTLVAVGFIPVIYNGAANLSAILIMTVDGQANPPWVFTMIEFGIVDISHGIESIESSSSYEGSTQSAVSIEGG